MKRAINVTVLLFGLILWVAQPSLAGGCHDPLNWEAEIAAFENQEGNSTPSSGGVVYVGSSTIRRWPNVEAVLSPSLGLNRGFGGSCMPDIIYYFDRIILPYKPSVIVVYSGENDLAYGDENAPREVLAAIYELVSIAESKIPSVTIYLVSIKPTVKRPDLWGVVKATNILIASLADKLGSLVFVDIETIMYTDDNSINLDIFLPDGIHLNERGYELWADALRETVFSSSLL